MYMQDHTGRDIAANISNLSVDTTGLVKDTTVQTTNSKLDDIKTAINNISSAISPAADNVTYNNTSSGLTATNVQSALDEVVNKKQNNLAYGFISRGDLNDYVQNANIWCSGMGNISNGPVNTGYGILEVIRCSATIYMQRFTVFATSGATMYNTYVRYYGNNQWYTWTRIN